MGTIHHLVDQTDNRPAVADRGPRELAHWKLLAARAEEVLSALEAAAAGRRRPGLAALTTEAAGLRIALENAVEREVLVISIAEAAYAMGFAAARTGGPRPAPGGGA
jgi:hypothetical protein